MKRKTIFLLSVTLLVLLASVYGFISRDGASAVPSFVGEVPAVFSGIAKDASGGLYFQDGDKRYPLQRIDYEFAYNDFMGIEQGHSEGILLRFKKNFKGKVLYGFYPDEPMKYPRAIFFKKYAVIKDGQALLNIKMLHGKYDIANWEEKAYGRLQYRVLTEDNRVITNRNVNFKGKGPFEPVSTVISGPLMSRLTAHSVVFTVVLNRPDTLSITVDGKAYSDGSKALRHEILVEGLQAGTRYDYTLNMGVFSQTHSFRTAPEKGSRQPFTWAFASDSRGGLDVGETNTYGTNAAIMKKLATFLTTRDIAFWQFTGDMISGYKSDMDVERLEYFNWFSTLSSYLYEIPLNVGMGNHEALLHVFDKKRFVAVDRFPFEQESAEALFAQMVANPVNGPESEDGSKYDPTEETDFPSYKENVYSYIYGNIAVIVLNSNYLYTPAASMVPLVGGNIHGYVMDNQLAFLASELEKYEQDPDISHVFVTIHTPAFPNGGHQNNDMWYKGNNEIRPYIGGKAVDKGIIERRDELIDLCVNRSSKFRVLLTGDEHNYSRLTVSKGTEIYPKGWKGKRLHLKRPFVQIVDGSAGAPYYGREHGPWTPSLDKFSAQYAVVLLHVDGEHVDIEVVNPESFQLIEKVRLH